jgi:hypothetical protein
VFPTSGVLLVCPSSTPGGPVSELHIGFPGATLTLRKHHYSFRVSYTERSARLAVVGASHGTLLRATVKMTGTVRTAKLITGTVSVKASGCNLSTSSYRAVPLKLHH